MRKNARALEFHATGSFFFGMVCITEEFFLIKLTKK
jgi:hypothetical protein